MPLVAGFFTDDGAYHASVGPEPLGKSYFGKDNTVVAPMRRMAWLCCARRKRQGGRRSTERTYEFPPSDVDCHLTRPKWNRTAAMSGTITRRDRQVCDRLHVAPATKKLAVFLFYKSLGEPKPTMSSPLIRVPFWF